MISGLRYFQYYPPQGYFDIYQNLTKYLRRDFDKTINSLLITYASLFFPLLFVMFFFLPYFIYVSYPEIFKKLISPNVLYLLFGLLVAIIWLPFLLKAANSIRDPNTAVIELKALMLVFIARPYTYINGLRYVDIVRLLEIAETEQNSADWRGSSINLLVVSTVTALASWLLLLTDNSWEETVEFSLNNIFSNGFEFPNINLVAVMYVVGLVFFGHIIRKFYNYFREYTISETSNRVIIIACKELIYHLEDKDLMGEGIEFSEKKKSIELFGCELVEIFDYDYPLDVVFKDDKNARWTLVCYRESLSLPFLFYPWRNSLKIISWLQEKISKYHKKSKDTKN